MSHYADVALIREPMEEFKIFTHHLAEFFKEELSASDETCREIEEMENFYQIRNFFEESEELKNALDIDELSEDVDRLEDEVDDLNDEVKELESEISELQHQLEIKGFKPATYWDEQKYELFLKYHERFSPDEFEALMTS